MLPVYVSLNHVLITFMCNVFVYSETFYYKEGRIHSKGRIWTLKKSALKSRITQVNCAVS